MSLETLYQEMRVLHGDAQAARWLKAQQQGAEASGVSGALPYSPSISPQSAQNGFLPHSSHIRATELLEPYQEALGAAYGTLHLLARWSVEHATESDPAPHLMTCYWTLEEALGLSERTLRRHLVEDGHSWSATVRHLIDTRHNYGQMLDGKTSSGDDKFRTVISSMVIRFFPNGRCSKNARVKRWGRRDLLADADEGRTRPSRSNPEKRRYSRQKGLMSAYSSVEEQNQDHNWLLVKLGQTVSDRVAQEKTLGNLYADIPTKYVLDALHSDLKLSLENARARGASLKRARSLWVDTAAKLLAERHGDARPLPYHLNAKYTTHADGFTDLWRRALWTAVKAELYGGTLRGWSLVERMVTLAADGKAEGKDKPSAWAWSIVREELEALRRDFGSGMAGEYLKPKPSPSLN